ncbi:MAG: hypothetical protein IMZ52_05770 [Actinobacteria bacterium]|nr:hypothetical protein [Actinomycetota bacterium]
MTKKCEWEGCDKTFTPKSNRQKYCSQHSFYNKRRIKREAIKRTRNRQKINEIYKGKKVYNPNYVKSLLIWEKKELNRLCGGELEKTNGSNKEIIHELIITRAKLQHILKYLKSSKGIQKRQQIQKTRAKITRRKHKKKEEVPQY